MANATAIRNVEAAGMKDKYNSILLSKTSAMVDRIVARGGKVTMVDGTWYVSNNRQGRATNDTTGRELKKEATLLNEYNKAWNVIRSNDNATFHATVNEQIGLSTTPSPEAREAAGLPAITPRGTPVRKAAPADDFAAAKQAISDGRDKQKVLDRMREHYSDEELRKAGLIR